MEVFGVNSPPVVVEPLHIAGATLILQFLLVFIMLAGVMLERTSGREAGRRAEQLVIVLVGMLVSMVAMTLSEAYFPIWAPMLGDVTLSRMTVEPSTALSFVFLVDYVVVYLLISRSGGGRDSQFTPLLFLLPTLSVFLRQPGLMILVYGAATAFVYLGVAANLMLGKSAYTSGWEATGKGSGAAYNAVTLLCLGLTILTGYITRPQPVL